jgi:type IV pilus assembly protein PilV
VLIALVIIAIGLLGVVGVIALAMNNNGSAKMQGVAALEASSLAASMEANPAFWVKGAGASATISVQGQTVSPAVYASYVNCAGSTCTNAEVAGYDLGNWGKEIAAALPGGTGSVTCQLAPRPLPTSPPAVYCTIGISWTDNRMSNNNTAAGAVAGVAHTYTLVAQP